MSRSIRSAILFVIIGRIGLQAQKLSVPLLPGEMPESVAHAASPAANVLSVGTRVTGEVDDNALNNNRDKQANLLSVIQPFVGWSISVPRLRWMLSYRPGFAVGRPISIYDSRSQLFDTNLKVRVTERLQLRLHDTLLRSKNVFEQLEQSELTQGSSVLDRPNNSLFAAARENNQEGGGDLSYELSARTTVGASAAFYRFKYDSALNGQAPGNGESVGVHAFSLYRLTRHHWIGFDYNIQDITSQQPQSRSFVQGVFYTDTLFLRPSSTVSFFLGPQHSITQDESGFPLASFSGRQSEANWSWAGGANYVWSSARTSLTLGLSRRISDGAGLLGIVRLSSASAELRRQLTKRWKSELLVYDNHNTALVSGLIPFSYISFAGGLSRAMNRRLSVEFQYWHLHETGSALSVSSYLADHNRISMSLQYDLKVPLQQ